MKGLIALVNPPSPPNAVSNKDTMGGFGQLYPEDCRTKIPPLDLAYTAAVLKKHSIPLKVIDCLGLNFNKELLMQTLKEKEPELIAVRTSTPTWSHDLELLTDIKNRIKCKIAVFGPHVTIFREEIINYPAVDIAVTGEPEFTIPEVVEKGPKGTSGIWYKENGEIIKNPDREFVENLDELSFPAWELMPYQEYDGGDSMGHIKPFVPALTSRGCPFGCYYCPYPVSQGKRWRARSISNVVDELEYLEKALGVKSVLFRDPEFSLWRERVVGICNAMIDKGLGIKWRCETRIDTLDEGLINIFARAGCIGINVGIESVDTEVLKRMGRKVFPLKKAIRIINTCKENRIDVFAFFILGLPGETVKSSLKTIKYAKRLNPNFVQFTVATPYKGTELYNWAKANGYINDLNLGKVTGFDVIMGNENITKEKLRAIVDFAYRYFRHSTIKEAIVKNFRPFNFLRDLKKIIVLRKQEKDILSG